MVGWDQKDPWDSGGNVETRLPFSSSVFHEGIELCKIGDDTLGAGWTEGSGRETRLDILVMLKDGMDNDLSILVVERNQSDVQG